MGADEDLHAGINKFGTSLEAVHAVQVIGLANPRGGCGIAELEREYQRYLTTVPRVGSGVPHAPEGPTACRVTMGSPAG